MQLIESALCAHKARCEVQALGELSDYKPEVVASGLCDVIEVCNLFLLRRLFIGKSLHQKGLVCKEHHYISLAETECPFCGAGLLQVENVRDEIIEVGRLHGVNITIVEHKEDLLAKYDGIAGVIYGRASTA